MASITKKTHSSQHSCEVNTMYLVNFELLKSLDLTIDYCKIKNKFSFGGNQMMQ